MLIKSTVELSQPIVNDLLLNEANAYATYKISERYERSKMTAIMAKETTLVLIGVIDNTVIAQNNPETIIQAFLQDMKLEGKIRTVNETTARDFWKDISSSERSSEFEGNVSLVTNEDLWIKYTPKLPRDHFDEHMVDDSDASFDEGPLYKTALDNELKRIAHNTNSVFVGHPVHYIIKAPVKRILGGIQNKLTQILFENHRLLSRHVMTFNYEESYRNENIFWDTAMTLSTGGCMVIDLADNDYQELGGFRLNQLMDEMIKFMHRYEHKVLFILRFVEDEGRVYQAFMERASGFSFVRIEPILMTYAQAVDLMTSEALRTNLNPEHFIPLLDKDQLLFSDAEVIELLSTHQGSLLKKQYFPEYSDVDVQQLKILNDQKGKAYKELMDLIGLDSVKSLIQRFVAHQNAQAHLLEIGMPELNLSRHTVFTGSPGTAKTTVARYVGKILKDQGILKNGDFIEVGRADLVAEYLGQTAVKVKNLFKKARGSILFIDEAYSLLDEKRGLYGDEAIATIVQEIENYRDEIVVILAGYPDLMEKFLSVNPGLKSRINFQVHFPDYNESELILIAHYLAAQQGYALSTEVVNHLSKLLREERSKPNFGNGRVVRNLLEEAILNHVARLYSHPDHLPNKEEVSSLEVIDFKALTLVEDPENNRIAHRNNTKTLN